MLLQSFLCMCVCSAVVTLIDWALLVVIVAMETACLWGVWLFIYDWRSNTSLLLALPFSWSWILIIYGVTYLEAITDLPFTHILDSSLHKYFLKHVIVRFPNSTKLFMMWRILKIATYHNISLILRLVRESLKAGYVAINVCVNISHSRLNCYYFQPPHFTVNYMSVRCFRFLIIIFFCGRCTNIMP